MINKKAFYFVNIDKNDVVNTLVLVYISKMFMTFIYYSLTVNCGTWGKKEIA